MQKVRLWYALLFISLHTLAYYKVKNWNHWGFQLEMPKKSWAWSISKRDENTESNQLALNKSYQADDTKLDFIFFPDSLKLS